MMTTRRSFLSLITASPIIALACPAFAASPETFQDQGIAINGIDPVGYFNDAQPVAGLAQHSLDWKGATWLFASAENMAMFEANPEAFAPKFGGYCAYAASLGYLANTIPEAWTIYEDILYLNANLRARDIWSRDIPTNIVKAEANWPGILA